MIQRVLTGILTLVLAAVLVCGCGREDTKENTKGQAEAGTEDRTEGSPSSDPTPQPQEPVVFEAVDMEGNTVTSDIFADAKLTMVNVWATYCNPCLSEMPDLGELAGEYDAGDFRLIGIVSDVMEGAEQEEIEYAAALIKETNASYTHLLLNKSLYDGLLSQVSAVPTTFFIDENGIVLGGVVGARDKKVWKEIIDGLLDAL